MNASLQSIVYPSMFFDFYEQTPPAGWKPRHGGVLENAAADYPDLLAHLSDPANSWKVKTEAEWQDMSAAEPWNGIGGVPYFVVDTAADTIRLPDTRGMYMEDSGFDGLDVGGVHGDAIRNISGYFTGANYGQSENGPFHRVSGVAESQYSSGNKTTTGTGFDSSLVVPTANKNQPRAFGVLPCVYVGSASPSTGGDGGGIGYSLEEQYTGKTWVNGKKIYQKTVYISSFPNNTRAKAYAHGIVNAENIVNLFGIAGGGVPMPFPTTGTSCMTMWADNQYLYMTTYSNQSAYKGYITLQYTCTNR